MAAPKIDEYHFGEILIDGKHYRRDLIIFPDRVQPNWWRIEGHSLHIEDLGDVLAAKPNVLVIGLGASARMQVPETTRRQITQAGIRLIAEPTEQACATYNRLSGQGHKVAVFVQAAAPVPAADLELIKNYANQRCAIVTGAQVASQGELMHAQRLNSTYVGNSMTVEGLRRIATSLNADHIVILRVVRWEKQLSYKPERSLLLLGATSFLDSSLQIVHDELPRRW